MLSSDARAKSTILYFSRLITRVMNFMVLVPDQTDGLPNKALLGVQIANKSSIVCLASSNTDKSQGVIGINNRNGAHTSF